MTKRKRNDILTAQLGGFGVLSAILLTNLVIAMLFYNAGFGVGTARRVSPAAAELAAQHSSALAAWAGVAVSAAALIVTAIGVWFVKRTLDATWAAVEDTASTTTAMVESNRIAQASSRPLMVFDIENALFEGPPFPSPWDAPEHGLNSHLRATYGFKNIGTQPCWIEAAWMTFFIAMFDDRGQLNMPDDLPDWFRVANTGLVEPGHSIQRGGGFYGVRLGEIDIIERGGGLIVFGMCQYRSLAGDLFCTRYAYQIPVQRTHNKSLDRGHPVANPAYWRDGLVRCAKLEQSDPIDWIDPISRASFQATSQT